MTGAPGLPATGPVVLDASFVVALLEDEPAAQPFRGVLARGVLPAITAAETFHVLQTAAGTTPRAIERGLLALGVQLADFPVAAAHRVPALRAADLRRREEQRAAQVRPVQSLSLGDLCCLAHAQQLGAPVLTGDRHWSTFTGLGVPVVNFRGAPR